MAETVKQQSIKQTLKKFTCMVDQKCFISILLQLIPNNFFAWSYKVTSFNCSVRLLWKNYSICML